MRTNPVGKPKDAHVQVYPTTNIVHTPPPPTATWCACSVAPDAPKMSAALEDVRWHYPPPPPAASRRRPWTPLLWRRRRSRAPGAPLAGGVLQGGGGGVRSSPFNLGTTCPF